MEVTGLSLISVGFGEGPMPYITSDRAWPSRLCRSSYLNSFPWDPVLHATHVHATLSLPSVSLGILPTFQIPVYLFSASCHRTLYFLRDGDYYCICNGGRSWSLEVWCKLRPAFYHYQQTLLFPDLIGWDLISR